MRARLAHRRQEEDSKKSQTAAVLDKIDVCLLRTLPGDWKEEEIMPMIDVYAVAELFPPGADRKLAEELTAALLRAEGVLNPAKKT